MTKITIAPSARTKRALTELAAAGDNPTLDAATVDALKRHAEAIKLLVRRASRDIIEIGHRLIKAQELAGHGNWLRWLDQEFDWSEQTARHYMRVYELSSIHNIIVDLDLPLRSLYLLAAPSTPEAARQEVINRTASGEKLSYAEVQATVAATKIKPKLPKPAQKLPSSYEPPDDIIDEIIVLFKALAHSDQHRCVLKLSRIFRGSPNS
jgi:hypothetical protein